jgi:hypothetical protein
VNCREFVELASAWLDGELPPVQRAAADGHLAGCGLCSRLVEDLAAADAALKAEPAAERSEAEWADFNRRLLVRVAMDARGQLVRRSGTLRQALRWSVLGAAAAAVLLLAAWAGYALRGRDAKPPEGGDGLVHRQPGPRGPDHPIGKGGPYEGEGSQVVLTGPNDLDAAAFPPEETGRADEELAGLLAAAEKVLVRLKNADPNDREELAAIRSLVIDSGLVGRLAEARGRPSGDAVALAAARSLEMLLLRVANGSPSEATEYNDIRNTVLDSAVIERSRSARSAM